MNLHCWRQGSFYLFRSNSYLILNNSTCGEFTFENIRKHSSRMCTDCRNGLHSLISIGIPYTIRYTLPLWAYPTPLAYPTPSPERTWYQGYSTPLTNTCENISFPQLCWQSVKKFFHKYASNSHIGDSVERTSDTAVVLLWLLRDNEWLLRKEAPFLNANSFFSSFLNLDPLKQ